MSLHFKSVLFRGVAKIQIDPFKISRKILTMKSSLWPWRHYRESGKNMNDFKNCEIAKIPK